jgi:NAD(P)H dehydrogenase (quinone)
MKFLKSKFLIISKLLTLFLCIYFVAFQTFAQSSKPIVLIAYYSQTGNTKKMAESIAEGAKSVAGVQVKMLPIDQVKSQDVLEASAIIVGSPVYNANIAPAVQEFINSWPFEGRPLKDKFGAAFVTGGGISIGEEGVMLDILRSMLIHGLVVMGGEEVEAAFGASAVTGEKPFDTGQMDPLFLKKGVGLGKRVAEWVNRGH